MKKNLETLIGTYKEIEKHKNDKSQKRNLNANQKAFLENLPKMCEVVSIDLADQIRNDTNRSEYKKRIDLHFLKDQRSNRKMEISDKEDPYYQRKILESLENQLASEVQITENELVVSIIKYFIIVFLNLILIITGRRYF